MARDELVIITALHKGIPLDFGAFFIEEINEKARSKRKNKTLTNGNVLNLIFQHRLRKAELEQFEISSYEPYTMKNLARMGINVDRREKKVWWQAKNLAEHNEALREFARECGVAVPLKDLTTRAQEKSTVVWDERRLTMRREGKEVVYKSIRKKAKLMSQEDRSVIIMEALNRLCFTTNTPFPSLSNEDEYESPETEEEEEEEEENMVIPSPPRAQHIGESSKQAGTEDKEVNVDDEVFAQELEDAIQRSMQPPQPSTIAETPKEASLEDLEVLKVVPPDQPVAEGLLKLKIKLEKKDH